MPSPGPSGRRRRGNQQAPTLSSVRGSLLEMFSVLQDVDVAPTPQVAQAVPVLTQSTQTLQKQWEEIQKTDLPQLKSQLGIAAYQTWQAQLPIVRGHHHQQGRRISQVELK